jgi:hypothetical protein
MPQHKPNRNQASDHQGATQEALQPWDGAGKPTGGLLCAPEVTQQRRPTLVAWKNGEQQQQQQQQQRQQQTPSGAGRRWLLVAVWTRVCHKEVQVTT